MLVDFDVDRVATPAAIIGPDLGLVEADAIQRFGDRRDAVGQVLGIVEIAAHALDPPGLAADVERRADMAAARIGDQDADGVAGLEAPHRPVPPAPACAAMRASISARVKMPFSTSRLAIEAIQRS